MQATLYSHFTNANYSTNIKISFLNVSTVYEYGREYLSTKGQQRQALASAGCRFCHIEQATHEIQKSVENKGYFIIKMRGCR
ncbi:DUF2024 domain-containing protein [Dyadobacter luteus]|jgi:hypothetical protein|uniref:DUF2024 domain-containing protein n=1 Tax=Dyadobacter luteus TaxID=2259619 RepID=A0A3D8YHU8_9BACT|nr:DUF2024 domain-containing protein [Dyadobacter luteus]